MTSCAVASALLCCRVAKSRPKCRSVTPCSSPLRCWWAHSRTDTHTQGYTHHTCLFLSYLLVSVAGTLTPHVSECVIHTHSISSFAQTSAPLIKSSQTLFGLAVCNVVLSSGRPSDHTHSKQYAQRLTKASGVLDRSGKEHACVDTNTSVEKRCA